MPVPGLCEHVCMPVHRWILTLFGRRIPHHNIRATMILTEGAVNALTAGALTNNFDINAIDKDGKEYYAPQVCCEDDNLVREAMQLEEFNPVLEVVRTEWHGFSGVVPCIKIYVKDGSFQEILMMASYRTIATAKKFHKQWGPGSTRKLSPGNRFHLLDYMTKMTEICRFSDKIEPVVLVESIRAEPKPKLQTKLTAFLAKNKNP